MTEQDRKDFEWASSYYLYDDLDKDGNEKETMKKAAKDKEAK